MAGDELIIWSVTFARSGDLLVASLSGEIDRSNSTAIKQEIASQISPGVERLVLDLNQLTFLDSAALTMVYTMVLEMPSMTIVAVPGTRAHRLLEISGLDTVIPLAESVEEATTSQP